VCFDAGGAPDSGQLLCSTLLVTQVVVLLQRPVVSGWMAHVLAGGAGYCAQVEVVPLRPVVWMCGCVLEKRCSTLALPEQCNTTHLWLSALVAHPIERVGAS
jgi:hypothetical protein